MLRVLFYTKILPFMLFMLFMLFMQEARSILKDSLDSCLFNVNRFYPKTPLS